MRTRAREDGFTLMELMVSAAIFALAVTSVVALLSKSVQASAAAADHAGAVALAESWLEQFRARQAGWTGGAALAIEAPELAVTAGTWQVPLASSGDLWSDGLPHDAEGRLAGAEDASRAIYCLHVRTTWLPAGTAVGGSDQVLASARVAFSMDSDESWPNCSVTTVDAALASGNTARAVVIPTMIRRVTR